MKTLQSIDLGPVIAFVGCDGAGKTTVSEAIQAWMRESRETESCHLGIQSKALGEKLVSLPLVGGLLKRLIASNTPEKVPQAEAASRPVEAPTTLAALAMFILSIRRLRRYQRMMTLRRKGVAIIADRFPQIAVPGMKIDGPGLSHVPHRNVLVRCLARCERLLYCYMVSYRPDVVIRLNVDLETAYKRKPDHRYASLASKIALVPELEYQGSPIVDLDSTQPLAEVIAQAKREISLRLAQRQTA
ncbi:nucleoside triphosphate hydrolase [Pseudomonas capeferrum]|uniref:nucleoside triphosphate hydrolase n=1 Tax=Pseudomonas capeferrum TaxID=1495066 RepID=UPI002158C6A5|nr:nucleoside triphosphate hydrolase [Pseudomonas capeferrum]MBA1200195.1 nucleoside triphosphate hydrolase [Pseudomonas capeferrum]